jgi:hypothetical protein
MNCLFCNSSCRNDQGNWFSCSICEKDNNVKVWFIYQRLYEIDVFTNNGTYSLVWQIGDGYVDRKRFILWFNNDKLLTFNYHPIITPATAHQKLSSLLKLIPFT